MIPYDRESARNYALHWAIHPNPQYLDYTPFGGDCTNFASQVLHAGGCPMNYDQNNGWFYIDGNNKSPSWTGVNFLYQFLVTNRGRGPVVQEVGMDQLEVGDLLQLSFTGGGVFQHTPVITALKHPITPDNIYVTTHTPNKRNYSLTSEYTWIQIRFLHILGSNP
jgi:hypothetical protein